MIIIAYIWIFFLVLFTVFLLVAILIDKYFDEAHAVKKWFRRNIVDWNPYEKRDKPE